MKKEIFSHANLGVILILGVLFFAADYLHHPQNANSIPLPQQQILKSEGELNNKSGAVDRLAKLDGIPVLMYHHVGALPAQADIIRRDLTVSRADFEDQMMFLKNHGFSTLSTAQLYAYAQGMFSLPQKPIVITFDDGYKDTFENAVPVLAANKMIGVFAVITAYAGFPDYAGWEDISNAHGLGMEIIPHTRQHIDFKNKKYSYARKTEEIVGSISDIKSRLGVEVYAFVYPYGNYESQALEILKQTSVKIAFTTKFGLFSKDRDLLLEPRVRVHGVEDLEKFENMLVLASKKE